MSRRHLSSGYEDPPTSERGILHYPRDAHDPKDTRDLPYAQERRTYPVIRESREKKYHSHRGDQPYSTLSREGGEISVASGPKRSERREISGYGSNVRGHVNSMDMYMHMDDLRPSLTTNTESSQGPGSVVAREDTRDASVVRRRSREQKYREDSYRKANDPHNQRLAAYGDRQEDDVSGRSGRRGLLVHPGRPEEYTLQGISQVDFQDAMQESFLPGESVSHQVITNDLQRFLGSDASYRSCISRGASGNRIKGVPGYMIRSSYPLTREIVHEMRAESQRRNEPNQRTVERPDPAPPLSRPILVSRTLSSEDYPSPVQSLTEYPIQQDFRRPGGATGRGIPVPPGRHPGGIPTRSSTQDSIWSDGQMSAWSEQSGRSSQSSYSAKPSSMQSVGDDRRRFQTTDPSLYPSSTLGMAYERRSFQSPESLHSPSKHDRSSQYRALIQELQPGPQYRTESTIGQTLSAERGPTRTKPREHRSGFVDREGYRDRGTKTGLHQELGLKPAFRKRRKSPEWDGTPSFNTAGNGPQ